MIIWGVNAMNHDASITSVDSSTMEILFAGHAERYSRKKNDSDLNLDLIDDARSYGEPELVVWFENPWGRKMRYLKSGQWRRLFNKSPKAYLKGYGIDVPIEYSSHHLSHAAGGFYTSPFNDAAVLVIDAIGETTTSSIWKARGTKLKLEWEMQYPHSIGLFYSAITALVGLKPDEEEYILMGMAAYGDAEEAGHLKRYLKRSYFAEDMQFQKVNFHKGITWDTYLELVAETPQGQYNLARAAQEIVTELITELMKKARFLTGSDNLVYSGGVALNCVANSTTAGIFKEMWIMPNPGDAGNSLGAVANYLRSAMKWPGPFLGHDIKRDANVDCIINELLTTGICGVAHGRAEFGPRALGNRSLLADPRRQDMKDRVNQIKRRQMFRPFAPAVLVEEAHKHFHFPLRVMDAPYMQYVVAVDKPETLPAVSHFDNTARVQTVGNESPFLREILEAWYERTGCPILLNTSLNIKGEPLVNTWEDAKRWEEKYDVKVF